MFYFQQRTFNKIDQTKNRITMIIMLYNLGNEAKPRGVRFMPMTEKLQKALMTPSTTSVQIADHLKRDGINCRDSVSLDTPLIMAARHNNLVIVQYLLPLINKAPDKNNILHAKNKLEESALNEALKIPDDKKIALLLLQNGVSCFIGINPNLPADAKQWLKVFEEYHELKNLKNLNDQNRIRRASAEFEIASRYYRDLSDSNEAIKWFELSAQDGHKQSMLNIALYYKEIGKLIESVEWYRKSYFLWSDPKHLDLIKTQLKNIADEAQGNPLAVYKANMALGSLYAESGETHTALSCFRIASPLLDSLAEKTKPEELFFKACSLWDGPDPEKNITALDYLDFSRRFELLIQAGTAEAISLIKSIILSPESKVLQLIACQIARNKNLFDESLLSPLNAPENQLYLQALSSLYGWNSQPKNTLRAASLFKKIVETSKLQDTETAYLSCSLVAFAYLQQERERDAYISEAFKSLDQAHACLQKNKSPHRREIIRVLLDGVSYVK
jgi:hypothetical protein